MFDKISRAIRKHTIVDGRKVVTTAGTELPLSATALLVSDILITAETDNTGLIAVGASTVVAAEGTQRGALLNPGDAISLSAVDLSEVYVDSTVSGDGVSYVYVT